MPHYFPLLPPKISDVARTACCLIIQYHILVVNIFVVLLLSLRKEMIESVNVKEEEISAVQAICSFRLFFTNQLDHPIIFDFTP